MDITKHKWSSNIQTLVLDDKDVIEFQFDEDVNCFEISKDDFGESVL